MTYLVSGCLSCNLALMRPALFCAACIEAGHWGCWLPFPPSTNNLFTQGIVRGKVRRFPSRRYKAWREEAVIRIRASWRTRPPYAVPVIVKLELTPRDARPRDADNYAKPVLDALVASQVLPDDSSRWVKSVIPYWENPADQAGVIVTTRPAKDVRKPALSAHERRTLKRIQENDYRLTEPGGSSNAIRSLVEKGYIRPLPGLLDDTPQGYAPAD